VKVSEVKSNEEIMQKNINKSGFHNRGMGTTGADRLFGRERFPVQLSVEK